MADPKDSSENDQYSLTRWFADKKFGLALGSDFIKTFNENVEIDVVDFQLEKPQEVFKELSGRELQIFYGFDARQEFPDERVFQYANSFTYENVGGFKLILVTSKDKVYKVVLNRTYSKKQNIRSYEWLEMMMSHESMLGKPQNSSKLYTKWITQYTEVILECRKAAIFFANELQITAKIITDIEKFPDPYEDAPR